MRTRWFDRPLETIAMLWHVERTDGIALGFAAHTLGQSIKWVSDRSEEFLATYHGRDVRTREAGIQDLHHGGRPRGVELVRRDYAANGGWETFLAATRSGWRWRRRW